MLEHALDLLNIGDVEGTIHYLTTHPVPGEAQKTFEDLVMHIYNEVGDVDTMIEIGRAGIEYGLRLDTEESKSSAKTLAYNLASFTWLGWDEEDLGLTDDDAAFGLEMAQLNLKLAQELQKEDLPMSRAYWVLGAQWLANGDLDEALRNFEQASEYARRADKPDESLLAHGFALMVRQDAASLAALKPQLLEYEYGEFFWGQIETAQRVFGL